MRKTYCDIFYINVKKISKKMFEKILLDFPEKTIAQIKKYKKYNDQKLSLASEILKKMNTKKNCSISHSGSYCCAIFANERVGIDFQKNVLHLNWRKIQKRNPSMGSIKTKKDFIMDWTSREAILKYSEAQEKMKFFEIKIKNDKCNLNGKSVFLTSSVPWKNYRCVVCSHEKIDQLKFVEVASL